MIVWVLTDGRIGSDKQAIAIAKILGFDYKIKHLKYNFLGAFPNFFKLGLLTLGRASIINLKNEIPDLVISAGRRAANIARTLKSNHKNCKLIQILNPDCNLSHIDALIIPHHDNFKISKSQLYKVVKIHGSLTYYPASQQLINRNYWQSKFKSLNLQKPIINMLIGGNSKNCIFKLEDAETLYKNLIQIVKSSSAYLFVSVSRRTSNKIVDFLKEQLVKDNIKHYFYDPKNSNDENPYYGFLSLADYHIVTADSISMVSEVLETNKPVFIFDEISTLGKKHKKFILRLFENNFAQPLSQFNSNHLNSKYSSNDIKQKILKLLNL